MNILKKFSAWLFVMVFILGTVFISQVSAQEEPYLYDTFDDGVIDTDLWWAFGPVAEYVGKIVVSSPPEGGIDALQEDLIGMWLSARGYQDIDVGEHVNIHLATLTPTNDLVTVGEYIAINPPENPDDPPLINNYIFCQWYKDGNVHHVDLQPAEWGVTYVFGLEYTAEGSILVWVNGQVVYSFTVPGVDIAYYDGGARFWFRANSVEGGDVTGEIDWVTVKDVKICDFSIQPGIEKCFGGIGPQCDPIPFIKHEDTCLVEGYMSVGSILHDKCCFENDNKGVRCANPDKKRKNLCKKQWKLAKWDSVCFRQWTIPYGSDYGHFGPYYVGGPGDDTTQDLRAPSGVEVHPEYEEYCSSGKCEVNAKEKTIIYGKGPCKYCKCSINTLAN